MVEKERVLVTKPCALVSLCFFGVPCRYHGKNVKMGHSLYRAKMIEELKERYTLLPLCPEQIGGLPTPRSPCLVTEEGKVTSRDGKHDYTEQYERGAREVIRVCEILGVERAYLAKNSPSCGYGYGILAKMLDQAGYPVHSR
jgi:uncharacterized protein YbbK (DUF523 family)